MKIVLEFLDASQMNRAPRRSLTPFSGLKSSVHARFLASFITVMCGFKFSVLTTTVTISGSPLCLCSPYSSTGFRVLPAAIY
jgi:hypothetical protein